MTVTLVDILRVVFFSLHEEISRLNSNGADTTTFLNAMEMVLDHGIVTNFCKYASLKELLSQNSFSLKLLNSSIVHVSIKKLRSSSFQQFLPDLKTQLFSLLFD